jgi:hypothetical protein
MARLLINVTVSGAQSAAAFEAAMNAALAPLLSHLIGGWDAQTTDKLPAYIREFRGILDVATGGTVIATPYTVKVIEAQSDTQAATLATTFIAANPLAFFAPALYRYTDQLPNITNRSIYFLLFNAVLADGQANWAPGYVVAGGGGGQGDNKIVTNAMSPYTVLAADGYLLVDTSAGAVTINMPSAATARSISIKDTTGNFSTNNCTLVPAGADKFENLAGNLVLSAPAFGRLFRSDPTLAGWFKI